MENKISSTQIITWVCVLMVLAMVVLLFTPYWQYQTKETNEEGKRVEVTKDVSISSYVWFPRDHKDLTKLYEDTADTKMVINDEVTMPVILLLFGVAAGCYSLYQSRTFVGSVVAFALGLYSASGYMNSAFMKMSNSWDLHVGVSFAAAAVGLAGIVIYIIGMIRKKSLAKAAQ